MSMDMPMINQSLKKANSAYHEEATCPLCVPRQAYHGTAWGKYEELKDQTNFGWPLYYDAIAIALAPFWLIPTPCP